MDLPLLVKEKIQMIEDQISSQRKIKREYFCGGITMIKFYLDLTEEQKEALGEIFERYGGYFEGTEGDQLDFEIEDIKRETHYEFLKEIGNIARIKSVSTGTSFEFNP